MAERIVGVAFVIFPEISPQIPTKSTAVRK
jgi:hypothetical protein